MMSPVSSPSAASWSLFSAAPSHGEQGDIVAPPVQGAVAPAPSHGEQGDLAAGRLGAAGMRVPSGVLTAGAPMHAGRAASTFDGPGMKATTRAMMLAGGGGVQVVAGGAVSLLA